MRGKKSQSGEELKFLAFSRLGHRLLLENGIQAELSGFLLSPPMSEVGAGGEARSRERPPAPPAAGPARGARAAQCPAAPAPQRQQRLRPLRLPERPCTHTSSVTLRSWLRRLLLQLSQQRGGPERLFGVSSPARLCCCRLLAAKEKSLCLRVSRSTGVNTATFVPALRFPSPLGGRGCCPGSTHKEQGFSNYPSCLHRGSSCPARTHTHPGPPSRRGTRKTLYSLTLLFKLS